jgi:hypothetical protein
VTLLDLPQGALRSAIHKVLRAEGETVTFALAPDDLFAAALGSRGLIYASAAAAGADSPRDEPAHLRAVLGAMTAPGQRRLVAVLSSDAAGDAAALAIQRSGAPYIILRVPRLLEHVGRRLTRKPARHHWVPGSAAERVVAAEQVAKRVRAALAADSDGVSEELAGEALPWAEIVRRLGLPKEGPRVHTLPDSLYRAGRMLGLFRAPSLVSSQP